MHEIDYTTLANAVSRRLDLSSNDVSGVIPTAAATTGSGSGEGLADQTSDFNEPDDDFGPPVHSILSYSSAAEVSNIINTSAYFLFQDYKADFAASIADLNLEFFVPNEFLALGGNHSNPNHSCFGKNALPNRGLWPNVRPFATALDEIRRRLGEPVRLTSVYRNDAYNSCLPGSVSNSQHKLFKAEDFKCAAGSPVRWRTVAQDVRRDGFFSGGIGIYNTFVHIDVRGSEIDWDSRR